MNQFRITKYDPSLRDDQGAFVVPDWTSHSDIGDTFGGRVLTEQQYARVESAYVATAIAILRDARVTSLMARGVEGHAPIKDGTVIGLNSMDEAFRAVLREQFWCRFESAGGAFVHFGYDFYMYIGVPSISPATLADATALGLFVEPFTSPYLSSSV